MRTGRQTRAPASGGDHDPTGRHRRPGQRRWSGFPSADPPDPRRCAAGRLPTGPRAAGRARRGGAHHRPGRPDHPGQRDGGGAAPGAGRGHRPVPVRGAGTGPRGHRRCRDLRRRTRRPAAPRRPAPTGRRPVRLVRPGRHRGARPHRRPAGRALPHRVPRPGRQPARAVAEPGPDAAGHRHPRRALPGRRRRGRCTGRRSPAEPYLRLDPVRRRRAGPGHRPGRPGADRHRRPAWPRRWTATAPRPARGWTPSSPTWPPCCPPDFGRPGTVLVSPMLSAGGPAGALLLVRRAGRAGFDGRDVEVAREFAARAGAALATAELYGEQVHLARVLQNSLLPPELPTVAGIEPGRRLPRRRRQPAHRWRLLRGVPARTRSPVRPRRRVRQGRRRGRADRAGPPVPADPAAGRAAPAGADPAAQPGAVRRA